jgi:hypothetical protein
MSSPASSNPKLSLIDLIRSWVTGWNVYQWRRILNNIQAEKEDIAYLWSLIGSPSPLVYSTVAGSSIIVPQNAFTGSNVYLITTSGNFNAILPDATLTPIGLPLYFSMIGKGILYLQNSISGQTIDGYVANSATQVKNPTYSGTIDIPVHQTGVVSDGFNFHIFSNF